MLRYFFLDTCGSPTLSSPEESDHQQHGNPFFLPLKAEAKHFDLETRISQVRVMFGILRLLTITSKGSHPLFENLSKDVSLTELYQQNVENTKFVENLSRYFNAFENLIECFAWADFNRDIPKIYQQIPVSHFGLSFFRSIRGRPTRFCSNKKSGKNWFPDCWENVAAYNNIKSIKG